MTTGKSPPGDSDDLSLRSWGREDVQLLESLQRDFLEVGTAFRDGELLNERKGKIEIACCEERQLTWDFILEGSVPAQLLALLPDHGGNLASQAEVIAHREPLDYILQRTQYEIGEGSCKLNGRFEVVYREAITAGTDRLEVEVTKGVVGRDCMQLLLLLSISVGLSLASKPSTYSQDCHQSPNAVLTLSRIRKLVSMHVGRDVPKQFVEKGHFEQFRKSNQLQVGDTFAADSRRRRCVWQRALSSLLNCLDLALGRIRESIGERGISLQVCRDR